MGAGATALSRLEEAAKAPHGDFKPGLLWKETVLDSVVLLGDYAIMGAISLGHKALEMSVLFSEKGDKKLACIVDCGRADLWYSKFAFDGCLQGKEVDIWIILMPSIDSDPCCYGTSFSQSMIVASLACCHADSTSKNPDIRFVHRDFYLANPIGSGFEWLPTFLAEDSKILPADKQDSMKAWFDSWVENVWNKRMGVHCACMAGSDEMEISEGMALVGRLLKEGKAVDDSLYRAPGHLMMIAITPEGADLQVVCTNMSGDALCSKTFKQADTVVELEAFICAELPQRHGSPTFFHESDKIPVDSNMNKYKELTARMPLVAGGIPGLVDFPQSYARFAVGACHGLTKECGLEEFVFDEARAEKWKNAEADIFIFADAESLNKEYDQAIAQLKECIPANALTVVMIAKEFESFKHPNFALRLSATVENCDVCVLATLLDIEKVKSVFLQKSPTYPNSRCLYQAMVPYPRLHFFALLGEDGKTCGREVPDGDLLFASVRYGSSAPTPPQEKLGKTHLMIGPEGPIHFLTVPGEDKATLVTPCRIIRDVFKMAIQAGCDEGGASMVDEHNRKDALDNIRDMRSEYKQCNVDEEGESEGSDWDKGRDEPAAANPKEPDGSLESARNCLLAGGLRDMKEVAALGRPPPAIALPLKAAAALMNVDISAADEWKDLQRFLKDSNTLQKMLDIEPSAITEEQWARVRTLAADADFTYDVQSRKSRFDAFVTAWVLALISLASESAT